MTYPEGELWERLEGLLCNISILRVEAEEVLSDIFGTESSDRVYGIFVPELLKSHTHNFSYGPIKNPV
ncbi:hypothetical protein N0V90_011304 [Kalmusia sp. IMI 367209]|nr:hypothetical protein N0V90_011304 [Kalmusia sp. IMI 367209]